MLVDGFEITWFRILILLLGYLLTLLFSGLLVKRIVSAIASEEYKKLEKKTIDTGAIIGKCENILIITFILIGAYTALALVFAAKSIVRSRAMQERPEYYLVGTMINFTFSILMGLLTKLLLNIP
jgi:hypothetical protein